MPTLLDDPSALCWKVCCPLVLPDIMQASRFSLLARGYGLLFEGCWRRVSLELSKIGICTNNFIRRLYRDCVGQLGTTMIPVATAKTILCNTFPITAKGGNTWKGLPCHDIEKALIWIASVSGWYKTNTGSWTLSLDANKSTYGWNWNLEIIFVKMFWLSIHSSSVCFLRDSASAS